jgi:ring-1,2-phenylacetyl-CoA epoxidase subunit PaaD
MIADDIMNSTSLTRDIWQLLEEVCDPEIPVLSITDLGIVRAVSVKNDKIEVIITPTYSGCPAMDMISVNIRMRLIEAGFKNITIHSVLSPAWTTDWMTERGKKRIKEYGIMPPHLTSKSDAAIICPQCNSDQTQMLSEFGSTACKSLYQCKECLEPFDYFKCH